MAGRPRQVSEQQAEGDVERVYHALRGTLRVTGVDVSFQVWAGFPRFLVAMWDALAANVETRAFEEGADALRDEALEVAAQCEPLGAWDAAALGESQRFHARGVLELYQSLQPKALLMVSAVRLALGDEPVGQGLEPGTAERIERGVPARMLAMEWGAERPEDARTRAVFSDAVKVLGPPGVPGELRALAMWPAYLAAAWERLRPWARGEDFAAAAESLRQSARRQARALPYAVALSRERVEALGEDAAAVFRVTDALERRLPALVLAVARWVLDVPDAERRPFPAPARLVPDWVVAGELR